MTRSLATLVGVLIIARACCAPSPAFAQEPSPDASTVSTPTAPAAPPSSAETDDDSKLPEDALVPQDPQVKVELDQRLKSLDNAGLNDEERQKAVGVYQQALESFEIANQQIAAALASQQKLDALKVDVETVAAKFAKPLLPYEDVSGESLAEIEKRATTVETSLDSYRHQLAEMEAEPKRRSQRLAELPKQISEAQQKLKQTSADLAALGGEEAADAVTGARRAALAQSELALQATLRALDLEQRLYQQGGEWVKLRRDYLARYVPYKEKRLAQLRGEINRRREADAEQQARQAAQVAEAVRPKAISELAEENKVFAEDRARKAADITAVSKLRDDAKTRLEKLKTQYDRAQAQVKVDELSDYSGQLLRQQQAELPNLRDLRRANLRRESARTETLVRIYEFYDKQSELANLDELADQIAARSGDLSNDVRGEIRQLLAAKRETLDALIRDYNKYSENLNELHSAEAELIATTESYADFIARRVLWIRSCAPLARRDLRPAASALAWSFDLRNWRDAGAAILETGARQPVQFTLFACAVVLLAGGHRPARRRLVEFGDEAEKKSCTKLRPTFHALWLTALVALPWPALLAFIGWCLDSLNESEFVRALSIATRFTVVCLLLLELVRHLCRRGGLADAHFDWPQACLVHLRKKLRWLTALGLPLTLWLVGLEVQTAEPYASSSLGRLAFITAMLLLAVVLHRILMAAHSPFRQLTLYATGGWLTPVQIAWRPAVVLLPLSLAILAAVGYYFTAQQAAVRVLQTVAMVLAVMALGGLTRRWLLVNRRRLAREQAKQRRAQLAAAAEADPAAPPTADLVDDGVDLAALSEQTQKLVRTFLAITTAVGLVLIWAEILPALAYPAERLLPGAEALTWGQLGAFLLVLTVTFICVRDIPALLELVVLQHLPLDRGSRYAFTTICRYLLAAIGLTTALNALGLRWQSVQWLVAAMSVGLGFGLQEIFANFVSGIILLFERPIRVGDIVTLGDKSGVVNRIRMRATTIVDWDRKEYIVPNKDLVTERLLNWTLSDQMNRIEVILMVAHGTETERACSLLLEAAREQQHILVEPPPNAAFEGFTDNGLKLALRCFLPTLEHRGATIHQLYTTIDRKLRAAGIEVAAPPREMRVRVIRDGTPLAFSAQNRSPNSERHSAA